MENLLEGEVTGGCLFSSTHSHVSHVATVFSYSPATFSTARAPPFSSRTVTRSHERGYTLGFQEIRNRKSSHKSISSLVSMFIFISIIIQSLELGQKDSKISCCIAAGWGSCCHPKGGKTCTLRLGALCEQIQILNPKGFKVILVSSGVISAC
ncbi:hypothetical protein L1987_32287 [Smallanthus sonchifolius]|uniref:Uncharacterized protein n=1 Tax=Smallanthus sonchifolius TaxID=185202 RepID=A0ACB9IAM6_9ASTR|nr:hypothetical protein L1987_32287 [Smallanthus sonchifolius]